MTSTIQHEPEVLEHGEIDESSSTPDPEEDESLTIGGEGGARATS